MRVELLALGTALPPHSLEQARAAEFIGSFAEDKDERSARRITALFRRTRIDRRHSVLIGPEEDLTDAKAFFTSGTGWPTTARRMQRYAQEAPPLVARAACQALEKAALAPDRITHLITVSCTGFFAPGLDAELVHRLELSRDVSRTHVGFMGCHGALNGLALARSIADADPAARVLVCAVELCSLHLSRSETEGAAVSNALFADGAAAAIVGQGGDGWPLASNASRLFEASEDMMTWNIGDHGFEMTLSARVPELIASELKPFLNEWLATEGLTPDAIRSWAIHPGGPRILESVEQALELAPAQVGTSREILRECGNMSSPTLLFILERLQATRAELPCVALGFGPGLVVEAALFG